MRAMTIVVEEELAQLAAAFDALESALRGGAGGAAVKRPTGSQWTIEQHVYHVALSASLALENVTALLDGQSVRIQMRGGPNETAQALFREGGYPRGQSQAPRTVWPPDRPDAGLLDQELRRNNEALSSLTKRSQEIAQLPGRIRHRQLGELCAAEWLRFAQLHSAHHLAIIRSER